MAYIEFQNVMKQYGEGASRVMALDGASFRIEKGSLSLILGASGAGKTTALNILGGMDFATSGVVMVDGQDITGFSSRGQTAYRRLNIGFVFQFYNLVPNLTALENVELAFQVCRGALDPVRVLEEVGLKDRMNNFPAQLSGGEQQRVSIARAIAKNPKLLLCDEPTGALDYVTGVQILELLQKVCREDGMTVVIITHNSIIAPMADRVIRFRSGKVISQTDNPDPEPVENLKW